MVDIANDREILHRYIPYKMTQIESLKVSVSNFSNDTTRISQFVDSRFTNLIFYPSIIEADIDYESYCKQLQAIKSYAADLTLSDDTKIIKEKISEIPNISQSDFKYYTWGIPAYLLFILLPVGLIAWTNTYIKVSTLQNKLKEIERSLGTLMFMLRALTS